MAATLLKGAIEGDILSVNTNVNIPDFVTVALFGDSHTYEFNISSKVGNNNQIKQSTIFDFIKNEIEKSSCFIDLFLEVPYKYKKNENNLIAKTCFIADTQRYFNTNFDWDSCCDVDNLRAHYIDLRRVQKNDLDRKMDKLRAVFNVEYYNYKKMHDKSILNDFKMELENDPNLLFFYQETFDTRLSLINITKEIIDKSKIPKQKANVYSDKILKCIEKMEKRWLNNRNEEENIEWKYLKWNYILDAIYNPTKTKIGNIYYNLTAYFGIVLDLYTISRMFRTFKNEKGKYSKPPENIIMFAGSFHTNRVKDFLIELGGTLHCSCSNIPGCKNVIKINKNYLPLFH